MDLTEASKRTGLAERTLYRYLEQGRLRGQKAGNSQGSPWEISEESLAEFLALRQNGQGKADNQNEQSRPESKVNGQYTVIGIYEGMRELVEALRSEIDLLRGQLAAKDKVIEERGREIQELHILLQIAQQAALPPAQPRRRWWPWKG